LVVQLLSLVVQAAGQRLSELRARDLNFALPRLAVAAQREHDRALHVRHCAARSLLVPELPAPDPNQTLRQQLAMYRASPACAGCHDRVHNLDLAFERFDGAGNYRADEAGAMRSTPSARPCST
jgi:hypothetical protein